MIVEFSVQNFRSIKEMQTISFVATGLKSANKYAEVDKNNIIEKDGLRSIKNHFFKSFYLSKVKNIATDLP